MKKRVCAADVCWLIKIISAIVKDENVDRRSIYIDLYVFRATKYLNTYTVLCYY